MPMLKRTRNIRDCVNDGNRKLENLRQGDDGSVGDLHKGRLQSVESEAFHDQSAAKQR